MFGNSAHLYDLIYTAAGKDYGAEAAALHALIQERNPGAHELLDVACGTGAHLAHLREHYSVTGVDLDSGMIEVARAQLPGVPLACQDMRTLHLDQRFDAVTCLFSSIGYLRDTTELTTAIGAMAEHLRPRGVLVVDGWVRPDAWSDDRNADVVVASADDVKVVRMTATRRTGNRTRLEMHYLVATHNGIEHFVEEHELTLFGPEEYEAAFQEAGLATETVDSPLGGRDRYVASRPL
jgi:SAM-dependent methyltransferase